MHTRFDGGLAACSTPFYTAFRVVFGLLFTLYGTQKLLGWPAAAPFPVGEAPWSVIVAGTVEIVCGPLIAVGLFTRIAAFISSGQMAVAYFWRHWTTLHGEAAPFWPTLNNGERAVLYCFAFLAIAALGAGSWLLDARQRRTAENC